MGPDDAQVAVEAMLTRHQSFTVIEDYIEERGELSDEQKSALWLYAWVEVDRHDRRLAVGELLRGAAHTL